jgi:alkyl sulfatase BDS1-like metallo-beta-lactamase superfamily hydrolase
LKPAPEAALAREVARFAGGAGRLADRARALASDNADDLSLRLAGHLVELATLADPSDAEIHLARAEVFERRVAAEASTMSKGVFAWAAAESRQKTS